MDLSPFYFINDSLFEHLAEDEIEFLQRTMRQKSYAKGDNIFKEGRDPKGVFILDQGKVKIYQTFSGREQIISIHVHGEIFGYRPLLCGERYPVTATAVEECKVSFVPAGHFMELLQRSTLLSNTLLRYLSYEFTVWVNTITNLTQRSARERLLLNLLILGEKYRVKKLWPIEITLSRSDLAALVGTTSETLARMMTQLRKDKLISNRGRTILINSPAQADKLKALLSDLSESALP